MTTIFAKPPGLVFLRPSAIGLLICKIEMIASAISETSVRETLTNSLLFEIGARLEHCIRRVSDGTRLLRMEDNAAQTKAFVEHEQTIWWPLVK